MVTATAQGSGKTLAFGIPIVQSLLHERARLLRGEGGGDGDGGGSSLDIGDPQDRAAMAALTSPDSGPLRALVLCPTRELAMQVTLPKMHCATGDHAQGASTSGDAALHLRNELHCVSIYNPPLSIPVRATMTGEGSPWHSLLETWSIACTAYSESERNLCAAGVSAHPGHWQAVWRLGSGRRGRPVAAQAGTRCLMLTPTLHVGQ